MTENVKKKKYIIFGVIAVLVVSIVGTLAWYTFGTKKSSLVLVLGNSDELLITLSPYELNIVAAPVTNYTSMTDYVSVTATNSKSVSSSYTLYYDIESIESGLNSTSMKYAVTRSTTKNGTYNEVAAGSFNGVTAGTHKEILEETIPAGGTYYYKIYTYLDGTQPNSSQLENKTMKVTIGADIVSIAGQYDKPGVYDFTVPVSGKYVIQLWGAEGGGRVGGYTGGKGAYVKGEIELNKGTQLYFFVGEYPEYQSGSCYTSNPNSSFNGLNIGSCAGGGGATDVRLVKTENWYDSSSLASRIIVAGAGGGAAYGTGSGGAGGELNGVAGTGTGSNQNYYAGAGGSQLQNVFGKGSSATTISGSGYYGGFAGYGGNAGGGSSYISGFLGCIAITSQTDLTPICNDTSAASDVTCSYHYSMYKFTNMEMIAGNKDMPSPSGQIENGHQGDGYARISFLG